MGKDKRKNKGHESLDETFLLQKLMEDTRRQSVNDEDGNFRKRTVLTSVDSGKQTVMMKESKKPVPKGRHSLSLSDSDNKKSKRKASSNDSYGNERNDSISSSAITAVNKEQLLSAQLSSRNDMIQKMISSSKVSDFLTKTASLSRLPQAAGLSKEPKGILKKPSVSNISKPSSSSDSDFEPPSTSTQRTKAEIHEIENSTRKYSDSSSEGNTLIKSTVSSSSETKKNVRKLSLLPLKKGKEHLSSEDESESFIIPESKPIQTKLAKEEKKFLTSAKSIKNKMSSDSSEEEDESNKQHLMPISKQQQNKEASSSEETESETDMKNTIIKEASKITSKRSPSTLGKSKVNKNIDKLHQIKKEKTVSIKAKSSSDSSESESDGNKKIDNRESVSVPKRQVNRKSQKSSSSSSEESDDEDVKYKSPQKTLIQQSNVVNIKELTKLNRNSSSSDSSGSEDNKKPATTSMKTIPHQITKNVGNKKSSSESSSEDESNKVANKVVKQSQITGKARQSSNSSSEDSDVHDTKSTSKQKTLVQQANILNKKEIMKRNNSDSSSNSSSESEDNRKPTTTSTKNIPHQITKNVGNKKSSSESDGEDESNKVDNNKSVIIKKYNDSSSVSSESEDNRKPATYVKSISEKKSKNMNVITKKKSSSESDSDDESNKVDNKKSVAVKKPQTHRKSQQSSSSSSEDSDDNETEFKLKQKTLVEKSNVSTKKDLTKSNTSDSSSYSSESEDNRKPTTSMKSISVQKSKNGNVVGKKKSSSESESQDSSNKVANKVVNKLQISSNVLQSSSGSRYSDGKDTKHKSPLKTSVQQSNISIKKKLSKEHISDSCSDSSECEESEKQSKSMKSFEILPNEEVFILRCPKKLNSQHLLNCKINLDGSQKFKINDKKFYCKKESFTQNSLNFVCAGSKGSVLKTIKPTSVIRIQEEFTVPQIEDIGYSKNEVKYFDLPCRHPIFGGNYKSFVKLQKIIKQKLDDAMVASAEPLETEKKPKKKKIKIKEEHNEEVFEILNRTKSSFQVKEADELDGIVRKERKKKRKEKINLDKEENSSAFGVSLLENIKQEINVNPDTPTRKASKGRKKLESANETPEHFTEPLLSSSKKKKKKHKDESKSDISDSKIKEMDIIRGNTIEESNSSPTKKSGIFAVPKIMENEITPPKHKKKKKSKDFLSSTIASPGISVGTPTLSKLEISTINSDENVLLSSKKKKHKKDAGREDDTINNLKTSKKEIKHKNKQDDHKEHSSLSKGLEAEAPLSLKRSYMDVSPEVQKRKKKKSKNN